MQRAQEQVVDQQVQAMLARSPGYRALPAGERAEIQRNTAAIVKTMAENELGRQRGRSHDPYALPLADDPLAGFDPFGTNSNQQQGGSSFTGGSQPGSASEYFGPKQQGDFGTGIATGVGQAGALLRQVNFPAFVSELVRGVFQAVVDASIQQMKAYGELVQSVAMSLSDFRDANVSENQARDHLVGKFPKLMQINVSDQGPRVGLRGEPEDEDLAAISSSLGLSSPLDDLDEETIESQLVPAARDDLARSRQALLATTLLMGINRIIVTDGKINAKMKFDFAASDQMHVTARDYDYENMGAISSTTKFSRGGFESTTSVPMIRLTNVTDTDSTAALEAKAKLTGEVSLNFRSESFDLNKLASADEVFRLERVRSAGRGAPGAPVGSPQAGGQPPAATPTA